MNVNNLVSEYYNNFLFAFLPNICNCSCDFCYVQPLKGRRSKLNSYVISNFDKLVTQAKKNGFCTIRITGGEPLIYTNLKELIDILEDKLLKYTLITNGQYLGEFRDVFNKYPPQKVTISYHSEQNYENIFKTKIDEHLLIDNVNFLKNIGTEVSIAIVYFEKNKNEIKYLIKKFEKQNIDDIKLILVNDEKLSVGLEDEFIKLNIRSNTKIRVTDLEQKKCLLLNRGFLSVVIEDLKVYDCCTNVGNSNFFELSNFSLSEILINQYKKNIDIKEFPCVTHINSCPIALKE